MKIDTDIKEFTVTLKVKALVNNNPNFPENAHAIEIVEEMIKDAKCQCIRLTGRAEPDNMVLVNYLEGKIKAYEAIERSLS
jgi:hypothetical protein